MISIISAILVAFNSSLLANLLAWAAMIAMVISAYFVYKKIKDLGFDLKFKIAKRVIACFGVFFKVMRLHAAAAVVPHVLALFHIVEFSLGWYEYFAKRRSAQANTN